MLECLDVTEKWIGGRKRNTAGMLSKILSGLRLLKV